MWIPFSGHSKEWLSQSQNWAVIVTTGKYIIYRLQVRVIFAVVKQLKRLQRKPIYHMHIIIICEATSQLRRSLSHLFHFYYVKQLGWGLVWGRETVPSTLRSTCSTSHQKDPNVSCRAFKTLTTMHKMFGHTAKKQQQLFECKISQCLLEKLC